MRILITLVLLLLLPVNAFSEDKGKKLYEEWCAQCHGYKGDADAYSSDFTFPRPRDLAFGVYKFRSTPTGDPPADKDLIQSIRKGNPGTSMPAWERFSDGEVVAIVDYIKKFSPDVFAVKPGPIKIGKAPSASDAIIKKGKELFKVAKCFECHGEAGRGNGEKGWEAKFKDDWGQRIYPANYTHTWELRNGSTVEDIYRTITVGLSGTPMTSYQDSLSDDDRWALAQFIKSLQLKRRLGIALRIKRVDAIPSSTDDRAWEKGDYIDMPMAGQIIFEPRHFTPTITNVRVRGIYSGSEVAMMLEWTDKRPNKGDDGLSPDAAHIQFPSKILTGSEKPYFFMGDGKRAVNIWQWKASDNLGVELNAKGPIEELITQQEKQDVKITATYNDGLYRVIFKRSIDTKDKDDIVFEVGRFVPFSVTLYDGQNNEEKNKGVVSAWYYIMLEPPTPLKVYILPPVVSFAVFGLGMVLHRRLKRKK